VLLSIWAAKVPAVAISTVSTDFPSMIGGMVALAVVGLMANYKFGLNECAAFSPSCCQQHAAISRLKRDL
jgi:hypothetical protein